MKLKKRIFLFVVVFLFFAGKRVYAGLSSVHGFAELDYGIKLSDDNTKRDDFNLLEQRLQLKSIYRFRGDSYLSEKGAVVKLKGDFTVDEYFSGKTNFELREFNLSLTPFDLMDVKLGSQISTWGTGDYLFINDMFPKDYVSFFAGRDDEYLKKPSYAIKTSFYPDITNIDFIIIPYFTPNTHAKGDRLSFFDSFQGGISGTNSDRHIVSVPFQLSNNEYALRIYRNFGSNEAAFYYFQGFDKSPRSYKDESARQLFYERLDVYGASIRGPIASGIGNAEVGYVYSREDSDGNNRLVANSMFKAMAGYTKDLGNDFSVGVQYFIEEILDYDNYEDNLLAADYRFDEFRHLLTNRITKLFKNQTVQLSLFTFFSPSDKDGYARPSISYDISDQWKVTFGANLPWGEDDITEFGQMEKNKNVFTRVRYNF
ncbi:MAG: hypothetical protein KAJ18_04255 [Candidatus Omnitrophica bacterium]|nr:hypothetical protein [Candidatus Omnitrophota bacterium]